MKVKVVRARSDNYWYADKIGETFDVIDLKDTGYDSIAPGFRFKVIESRSARYIAERDCVFILTYKEKAMKKSDLKTGMRVVHGRHPRRTEAAIVVSDLGKIMFKDGSYNYLHSYYGDLKCSDVWDITEVYAAPARDVLNFDVKGDLLWKREEKTPEQIQLDKVMNQITELQKQASQLQELINK